MPQKRLFKQASLAKVKWKRPVGQLRTSQYDYIEDLGWNDLGLHPREKMEVVANRDVRRLNVDVLPSQPSRT